MSPGLSEEEAVSSWYHCQLLKYGTIPIQGTLYITQHHLCFYSGLGGIGMSKQVGASGRVGAAVFTGFWGVVGGAESRGSAACRAP